MGFVGALTNQVAGQLALELKLAACAGGGNGAIISLSAAKPQGVGFFLVFQSLQSIVGGGVIQNLKLLGIGLLDAGFLALHLVGQGGDVDHLRLTAHVGEGDDVTQFLISIAGAFLVHQEGHVSSHAVVSPFTFGRMFLRLSQPCIGQSDGKLLRFPYWELDSWITA